MFNVLSQRLLRGTEKNHAISIGYLRFGEHYCFHLPEDGSPKRWHPTTTLHGVTTQKTSIWSLWRCETDEATQCGSTGWLLFYRWWTCGV